MSRGLNRKISPEATVSPCTASSAVMASSAVTVSSAMTPLLAFVAQSNRVKKKKAVHELSLVPRKSWYSAQCAVSVQCTVCRVYNDPPIASFRNLSTQKTSLWLCFLYGTFGLFHSFCLSVLSLLCRYWVGVRPNR